MGRGNSYTRIIKHTSLFAGVQGLNILIGLVRTKFVAVLLGPVGVGLLSIYNTATAFLQNATNFGIQMTGVREISVAYKTDEANTLAKSIRVLRSWSLVVALLGFFVTIALSGVLSRWAFSDGGYTFEFALLAPVVALATITGGETAVLKATRRLSQLAKVSVLSVFGSLILSVPLYFKFGNAGIIPSLILVAVVQMLLTIVYSYRFYPLRLKFGKELREGRSMLVVGAAFILAGICGSGAEFVVRAYLSDVSLSLVGLYNTGYMITMTYAGTMFAAMETDYFPFLSSVCSDTRKMNGAVNRQIEVSMIMVAPFLVMLMVGLPVIIPLLFSVQFLPVVGMTQYAVLAMYCRAIYLPVAYITLAKGDSRSYFMMELLSALTLIVCITCGYSGWGLEGTGMALAIASLIETACVVSYCAWRYDFVLSSSVLTFILMQIVVAVAALVIVKCITNWYWICVPIPVAASIFLSLREMKKRVDGGD
ncbi:MAG: oligosaccharide flippase family protein [Prevotella sp.]|nr:oligosaccharide flippase family protein [Prevotella sp.]